MAESPHKLSAAAGPAKWAAVCVLSAAAGGGLVWSLLSREAPGNIGRAPETVTLSPALLVGVASSAQTKSAALFSVSDCRVKL